MTMAPERLAPGAFADWLAQRDEPSWLLDRRRSAFERFSGSALPTLKDEEWRRTDVRGLKWAGFGPAGPLKDRFGAEGRDLPTGVVALPLAEAVKTHGDLVRAHLGTVVDEGADALAAWQSALWNDGAFLYVPAGVKLEVPFNHSIAMGPTDRTDYRRTLVVLEEGAEATLVQETKSQGRDGAEGLHLGAVEIVVGPKARLRFVNVQAWDDRTWHFSRERAVVKAGGRLQWTVGALGSRLSKVNQDVALAGERARAQVNGVMFTTGRQHLAYYTRQDHQAPHTTSDLLYKGALKDKSRIVWKGLIRVDPGAQKTDAYQKNNNLLLSDAARADSIPGLEIEANDVRCTHGATASRVDEQMVYYAQSRGLRRDEATRLIVSGFFANVFDRIAVEPAREALAQAVAVKLGA